MKIQWNCALIAILIFDCTSSMATSRMGEAIVSESAGLPCFSVPANPETNAGVPLRSLVVSEIQTANWKELPPELWSFNLSQSSARPALRPKDCIRYGEAPTAAIQTTPKPLAFFRVYYVSIRAKTEDSSMIAYVAKFCIKPRGAGVSIQVVPLNEWGEVKRYEVCSPQP